MSERTKVWIHICLKHFSNSFAPALKDSVVWIQPSWGCPHYGRSQSWSQYCKCSFLLAAPPCCAAHDCLRSSKGLWAFVCLTQKMVGTSQPCTEGSSPGLAYILARAVGVQMQLLLSGRGSAVVSSRVFLFLTVFSPLKVFLSQHSFLLISP